MSGSPQFPDPLGAREVYRPGATQHKAGPDLPRKVLALEQGALGRPGPGVANGSVPTSVSSQTGGVEWLGPQWTLLDVNTARGSGFGTSSIFMPRDGTGQIGSTAGVIRAMIYLDPAELDPSSNLSMVLKLRAWCATETDPTDSTLTASLVEVTGLGATGTISSVGSNLMSASLSPTAATTRYVAESGEYTLASAGYYAVRFVHSVNPAQTISYGYRLLATLK